MADKNDPIPTYQAPGYTEKYSNNISVESRLLDFRLRFGVGVYPEPGDAGAFMVEYFGAILVSPTEAKYLAAWLNQEVRRFEECFGPIPMPKPPAPSPEAADTAKQDAAAEVIQ